MPYKRALRDLRVPSDYIEWMSSVFPSLRDMDADDRVRLLWLVMDHEAEWRAHEVDPNCFIIPSAERERLFNKRFDRVFDLCGLFDRQRSYDHSRGLAAGFSLSLLARFAHDEHLSAASDCETVHWITGDGAVSRRLPSAVASRDRQGNPAKLWRGTKLPNVVRIDCEGLARRIAEYRALIPTLVRGQDVAHAKRRLQQCVRALREANTTATAPGDLPQRYREVDSGRLAALGLNGQSMAREVRAVAFHGYYDYDIENCHFVIAAHICRQLGIPHPVIEAYSVDKEGHRLPLCERYWLDDDELKTCILASLYGATDILSPYAAIPRVIGIAEAKQLLADPWFSALRAEIEMITAEVIRRCGLGSGGLVVNAANKGIEGTAKPAKIFAHLLQGLEGKMLRAVCRRFPDDIVVPVHDGFISRRRLDVRAIAAVIKASTGCDVRIKERVLEPADIGQRYKESDARHESKLLESMGARQRPTLHWRTKDLCGPPVVELCGPAPGSLPLESGVTLGQLRNAARLVRLGAEHSAAPAIAAA